MWIHDLFWEIFWTIYMFIWELFYPLWKLIYDLIMMIWMFILEIWYAIWEIVWNVFDPICVDILTWLEEEILDKILDQVELPEWTPSIFEMSAAMPIIFLHCLEDENDCMA